MGSTCSDTCKSKQDLILHQALSRISSLPYLTQFKSRKAIIDTHYISLPLSTDGAKIVDSFGRRVKLCCYNLKGCHSIKACVSSLELLTVEQSAAEIKSKGFNTVIIPFSLDLFFENPKIENQCLGPNVWMRGKKALEILDITINGLTKSGLLVMLRNACSKASYFKQFTESDGLWWSDKYPQSKWIECLKSLANRYSHNPRMFGIQIRHTLKKTPNHEPTWGTGNTLCDWKRAAQLACNEILSQNKNLIVIITGDQRGDLRDIAAKPLDLNVKNKLVFAAKLKPFAQKPKKYDQLKTYFDQSLNCIRNVGYPLILTTVTDRKESDWKFIIDFLEQSDLDWGYSSYPSHFKQVNQLFTNENIIVDLKRIQISSSQGEDDVKSMDETEADQLSKQIEAILSKKSSKISYCSEKQRNFKEPIEA